MPAEDDRLTELVADSITRCQGIGLSFSQAKRWAVDLLSLIAGNNVSGKEDWRQAMEFFGLGTMCASTVENVQAGQPYDPPRPDALTQALLSRYAEIAVKLGANSPVPANAYLVGVRGPDVFIGVPPVGRLEKGAALNLAVWLVALADPTMVQFAPMLAKVLQT